MSCTTIVLKMCCMDLRHFWSLFLVKTYFHNNKLPFVFVCMFYAFVCESSVFKSLSSCQEILQKLKCSNSCWSPLHAGYQTQLRKQKTGARVLQPLWKLFLIKDYFCFTLECIDVANINSISSSPPPRPRADHLYDNIYSYR